MGGDDQVGIASTEPLLSVEARGTALPRAEPTAMEYLVRPRDALGELALEIEAAVGGKPLVRLRGGGEAIRRQRQRAAEDQRPGDEVAARGRHARTSGGGWLFDAYRSISHP